MARELVERLFPNLEEVLAWHSKANQKMKDRVRAEGFPVGDVADILREMVRISFLSFFLPAGEADRSWNATSCYCSSS